MTNNIFEVGGSIRDSFLGIKSKDRDFAVETESFDTMRDYILSLGGKIFLETPEHFTIRANVPNIGSADYVLCRKEGPYSDGRHPDWVKAGTINDDLARRDFTVNAMARNVLTGEFLDPYNGREDVALRKIRCVRDAGERMREDRLRAFRAVRFCVTKGFDYVPSVGAAINYLLVEDFASVSTERIREEISKMYAKNFVESHHLLFNRFPVLGELVLSRGIWFKPTTEQP